MSAALVGLNMSTKTYAFVRDYRAGVDINLNGIAERPINLQSQTQIIRVHVTDAPSQTRPLLNRN